MIKWISRIIVFLFIPKGEIMSAIQNLKDSVVELQTKSNETVQKLQVLKQSVVDLTTAVSALEQLNPDIETAAAAIRAVVARLNEEIVS